MEEYYLLCSRHFLWPVSFFFFYFEHHCLCLTHWMAGQHNMVIQSLSFSDLWCCFLLQHFFAKLQDKMDQKHFVESHTTEIIDYSMLMQYGCQSSSFQKTIMCFRLWLSLTALHSFPKKLSSFWNWWLFKNFYTALQMLCKICCTVFFLSSDETRICWLV